MEVILLTQRHIGHALIGTANMLRRSDFGEDCAGKPSVTAMQNFFLGVIYMAKKHGRDVYQKDLEAEFSIRRSTASGILALMEQNGLLVRTPAPQDARLKILSLTPRALEICAHREEEIERFEQRLTLGLSQEEIDTFFSLLERIRHNIKSASREDTKS